MTKNPAAYVQRLGDFFRCALFLVIVSGGIVFTASAPWAVKVAHLDAADLKSSKGVPFWQAYLDAFVSEEGRVIDTANGGISHSEGQGYGLLLAVAAGDEEAFDRMWSWTRQNLQIRASDRLLAWRWTPGDAPHVTDWNNATDGDLLVGYALLKAAKRFNRPDFLNHAKELAVDLEALTLVKSDDGVLLMPGVEGFSPHDRRDGPVINLSYWVFPALEAFAEAFGAPWEATLTSGSKLLEQSRFSEAALPPEWLALGGREPLPAAGFDPVFGYNAVRVPLYLAWGATPKTKLLEPFAKEWPNGGDERPRVRHLMTGQSIATFAEPGYRAVAALTACRHAGTEVPEDLRTISINHYYPSTLHALALMVVKGRHPECL